ncbi:MAG: DNA-processing protein DprA [bacterium]
MAEPGDLAVAAFVVERGPVAAAAAIRAGQAPNDVAAATEARRTADGEADLEAGARHDVRLVTPESPDWPHFAFAPLYRAQTARIAAWRAGERAARYGGEPTVPLALWIRGPAGLDELGATGVAVVGARAATAYGEQVATEVAYGVAGSGRAVVSGGAFGIDAAAHRAALAADGPTVLVSAGGLDRPYPPAHARLFEDVAAQGLLVSESPPGSAPQRHRFLSRNRLIAALSAATVVVEAARRSGALNTAAHAATLGRLVLAVPGPVTSAMSVGCHDLLRRSGEPAQLVTGAGDVLAVVGGGVEPARLIGAPGTQPVPLPNLSAGGPRPYDELDPVARSVLDGFPARRWIDVEGLCRASGRTAVEVIRTLPVLQLAGLVESGREGHRLMRGGGAG